jgi:hypothetical protein
MAIAAAVILCACGSVTASEATRQWMNNSDFRTTRATLVSDAKKSVSTLRDPSGSTAARRTICQVLYTDTAAALSSLPSPDGQANALLNTAYLRLGNGASRCYHASSTRERSSAAALISAGVLALGLGSLRLAAVVSS